jgi:hypothetical protein
MRKNVGSTKSIDGKSRNWKKIYGSNGNDDLRISYRLKKLYNTIGDPLTIIMNNYIDKEFDKVLDTIKLKTFNDMLPSLFNQKLTSLPEFEKVRITLVTIINMLSQSSLEYREKNDLQEQLNITLEKASILDDNDKLLKYIRELQQRMRLLPPTFITAQTVGKLKPQYSEYIKLYGYPENHIFNSDKLGQIITNLNAQ